MIDEIANRLYGMSRMVLLGTLSFQGIGYLEESPVFTEGLNLRTGLDLAYRILPTLVLGAFAYEGLKDAENGTIHGLEKKIDLKD